MDRASVKKFELVTYTLHWKTIKAFKKLNLLLLIFLWMKSRLFSLGSNSPLCSLQLVLVINILRASMMTCVCMRSAPMLEIGSNGSLTYCLFFGESWLKCLLFDTLPNLLRLPKVTFFLPKPMPVMVYSSLEEHFIIPNPASCLLMKQNNFFWICWFVAKNLQKTLETKVTQKGI